VSAFQKAVHDLIEELKVALPAVFESEDYQKQRGAVEQAIQAKSQASFAALNEKALAKNIAILRTPLRVHHGTAPRRQDRSARHL
jgi:hypothetical protein